MCARSFRYSTLLLAFVLVTGVAYVSEAVAATSESVPLPRARPVPVPFPEVKPDLLAVSPEDSAEPTALAPDTSVPLPRTRPDLNVVAAAQTKDAQPPLPAARPAEPEPPDATPLPQEKPGETDVPVPDAKPVEAEAPPGDGDLAETTDDSAGTAGTEDKTPKPPLFAEDAMSPACAAIEEGRVSGRPLKPIEDPAGCVVPAVYAVSSVGSERSVTLTPEAELTCAMTDRLDRFVEEVVEPAARDILGSDLTGLGIAGSYVCRTRNGQPDAEPSEHGKANAIDVASFTLADGRVISVAADWTLESEAEQPVTEDTPAPDGDGTGDAPPADARQDEAETVATDASGTDEESRDMSPAERFLRAVHEAACGPFTTVIGPEGDVYHRDHLHFDRQTRGAGGETTFCQ